MIERVNSSSQVFRRLHEGPGLLVLPNVWDAGGAALVQSLGATAIATTSAGVAWSHGYADGEVLPVRLLAATILDIARIVIVPITADIEGGYSADPVAVGETAAAIIDAGAVGINIEDGVGSPDLLCAKIEQIKHTSARLGADLFVNVRTDVFLRKLTAPERAVEEVVARAERYARAGGDGIFVPGASDPVAIRALADAIPLPLNVMAVPGLPGAEELAKLGVRRLSAGSGLYQTLAAAFRRLSADFLATGQAEPLVRDGLPYPELNNLYAQR